MHRNLRGLAFVAALHLLGAGLIPASVQAQSVSSQAEQATERLNRENLLRIENQRAIDARAARPRTSVEVPLPKPVKSAKGKCRQIETVTLKNATLIDEDDQRELLAPFQNRCLDINDIEQLLADVTGYYITHGYAASRAYVPEQDLTRGTLEILVIEGQVKAIKLEDGGKNSIFMPGAFPGIEGKPLNLRDFEQGLDQVNRLTSNNATLDIQPGEAPGDSVVVIKNEPRFPLSASLVQDSFGLRSTGRYQVGATVSGDGLLGLNEFISFTKRKSTPFNERNQNSESENLFFSIPYGGTTFSAGATKSNYQSSVLAPSGTQLAISGDTRNIFARIDQNLWRSQVSRWNASVGVTQKESNNYLVDQRLGVSSRTLTVLDVDTDFSTQIGGGFLTTTAGLAQGLRLFDALKDADGLPNQAPRAQFTKLKFGANYTLPFEALERAATFTSALTAQYALDALYGSEQLLIGGPYTVRGFYGTTLANDHGAFVRNDLAFVEPLFSAYGVDVTIRPYVGLDAGFVQEIIDETQEGTLIGGAVGFTLAAGPHASFDAFVARGLAHPDSQLRSEGTSTFGRFAINF